MSTPNAAYWHALNIINPGNLWKYLGISQSLGGIEFVFKASIGALNQNGSNPQATQRFIQLRSKIDVLEEYHKITRQGIQLITHDQPDYPQSLKLIPSSPPLIYIRGNAEILGSQMLGVVGSRKISTYGKSVVKHLVPSICDLGIGVVSGLAYGVDAAALDACLEAGGKAVAVLASSLIYNEIAPKANLHLAQRIEQSGCLVSENPPGAFVGKMHFPLRNRIVSGLSSGVVVIEAGLKSGSLITARLALDHGKDVFAIPGSIFAPNSEGTLELIKRGAKCVTSIRDIAQEFGWDVASAQKILEFDNALHKIVYDCINLGYNTINLISEHSQLSTHQIMIVITELELMGALQRGGNGVYHKVR